MSGLRMASFVMIILCSLVVADAPAQQYSKPDKPMKYWSKKEFRDWEREMERLRSLNKTTSSVDRTFGLHNGNLLRTLFYNYGSIGRPNTEPSIEWPILSGHGYAYEFGAMVGAEVTDRLEQVQYIFSDGMLDGGEGIGTEGSNWWGWEPLPGWAVDRAEFNSWSAIEQDKGGIAVSNRPRTWGSSFPENSYFSGVSMADWTFNDAPYLWPGQFGDSILTADLESYYRMDDRWNYEFEYFPFPDDSSRRGIGVEVTVRGYQYAASLAEDIIFFIHEVKNVSDRDLDKVVVGMIGDPHVGGAGDFSDDFAGFVDNDKLDSFTGETHEIGSLVYAWDNQGSGNDFGIPWNELGWLAFKFLESPGNFSDGIDNDRDGMTDENRTNGIDDDGDWDLTDEEAEADTAEINFTDGIDGDLDGRIDDLGDLDKKSDDLNGNGVPDPGEPDFDATDLDESDQLGLTSFAGPIYGTEEAQHDDVIWTRMTPGAFSTEIVQNADNIFIFGSGYFPLEREQTENFSIAVIVGANKEDMLDNAFIAEWIFRLNFQFTKPPDPPNVWAVAGDKKVTLYWDDISEQSVDPVFGKDFEGYKIYRSTRPGLWGTPITTNKGVEVAQHPIAQFDLIDGIEGTHPVEFVPGGGIHFFTGKETGLEHVYVDSPLINDITYYYAVTAYDMGNVEGKITPLESPRVFGGPNVISDGVTPRAPAAGFRNASLNLTHTAGVSTAKIKARIIDVTEVDTSRYLFTFTRDNRITALNLSYNPEGDSTDTTVIWDDFPYSDLKNLWNNNFVVGPYKVFIEDETGIEVDTVEWIEGDGVLNVTATPAQSGNLVPRDFEMHFFDDSVASSVIVSPKPINFLVFRIEPDSIDTMDVVFQDFDNDSLVSPGDQVVVVTPSIRGTWQFKFRGKLDTSRADSNPQPGAVLKLFTTKPLEEIDRYVIRGTPAEISDSIDAGVLDRIAVVPNPYVSASSFETPPPEVFSVGRGERKVNFIHLPMKCTIRIYTIAGEHLRTIEHESNVFDGTEPWDLLTRDGMDIAFGIYIYHIEAPGIGNKIGRIAVIK